MVNETPGAIALWDGAKARTDLVRKWWLCIKASDTVLNPLHVESFVNYFRVLKGRRQIASCGSYMWARVSNAKAM